MKEEHALKPVKPIRVPWNKGKLVGAKPPLRPSHVWSIRTKLQIEGKKRDLALSTWRSTASSAGLFPDVGHPSGRGLRIWPKSLGK